MLIMKNKAVLRLLALFFTAVSFAGTSYAANADEVGQVGGAKDLVRFNVRLIPPGGAPVSTVSVSSFPGGSATLSSGNAVAFDQSCAEGKVVPGTINTETKITVQTGSVQGSKVHAAIGLVRTELDGMSTFKSGDCEVNLPRTKNWEFIVPMLLTDGEPITTQLGELGSIEVTAGISRGPALDEQFEVRAAYRAEVLSLLMSIDARLAGQNALVNARAAEQRNRDLASLASMQWMNASVLDLHMKNSVETPARAVVGK